MAKASGYLILKRHRKCFTNDEMEEPKSFKINTEKPGGDLTKLFYLITNSTSGSLLEATYIPVCLAIILLNDSLLECNVHSKITTAGPGPCAQLVGGLSRALKGHGFKSWLGKIPRLQV